jgi:LacI family transcriptional regulator, galactose operon repressor
MSDRTPVRLQDVAEKAGVSIATASRVLSDPAYAGREGLRERVTAAAAHLGYRPNPHARALASSTSTNVGLVVHDISDAYFATVSSGVIAVADRHDLLVSMVCSHRDPARELDYVRRLIAQRVRALILAGSSFRSAQHNSAMLAELTRYQGSGGSIVSISHGRDIGHAVQVDSRGAMRDLTAALISLGHKRFGVVAGPSKLTAVHDRLQGIKDALRDSGLELAAGAVSHQDISREGGAAGAAVLLTRRSPPTCLIATSDVMAVGAQSWALNDGYRVPDDISITGFGGIPAAADAVPPITTVSLPLTEIGQTAMELALQPPDAPRHIVQIEGKTVMRPSVAAPATSTKRK